MERCKSQFCIVKDGIRGREFTPPENAEGIAKVWCPDCVRMANQVTFYASRTANMVRTTYKAYVDTELPKEVKLILEQFAMEIVKELGEEL